GLQATDRVDEQPAPGPVGIEIESGCDHVVHHHRHPEIRSSAQKRTREVFGSNPDDGEGLPVYIHGSANDAGLASEEALPSGIAQHYNRPGPGGSVFLGKEDSPKRGLHAEDVEIVCRHKLAQSLLWLAIACVEIHRSEGEAENAGEYFVLLPIVLPIP